MKQNNIIELGNYEQRNKQKLFIKNTMKYNCGKNGGKTRKFTQHLKYIISRTHNRISSATLICQTQKHFFLDNKNIL